MEGRIIFPVLFMGLISPVGKARTKPGEMSVLKDLQKPWGERKTGACQEHPDPSSAEAEGQKPSAFWNALRALQQLPSEQGARFGPGWRLRGPGGAAGTMGQEVLGCPGWLTGRPRCCCLSLRTTFAARCSEASGLWLPVAEAEPKQAERFDLPRCNQQVRGGNQQKDNCRERLCASEEGKVLGCLRQEDRALAKARADFNRACASLRKGS